MTHANRQTRGPRAPDWTQDEIAQLQDLIRKGHSPREIAVRMGRSRNAVIGKTHRLHHSLPSVLTHLCKTVRPQSMVRPILRATTCEYPTDGKDGSYHFCGQETDGHSSYCHIHHTICSSSAPAPSYHEAA